MLAGVDAMVFDVQDVGSRYYTFVYTMLHVMEACAREKKRVVVLDRPNPIRGDAVDGNVLDPEYRSFVGLHPLAVRHGMTAGELALMFREELALDVDLHVVPMKGWRRRMAYEDTGLPWVLPSPNIPTVDTAFVYPGGCLVEGTNLSEGRGTTRPFELVGAPWLDGHALARSLERERIPGAGFRAAAFTPTFQKHVDVLCHGVQVHVFDRGRFPAFLAYLLLIHHRAGRTPFASPGGTPRTSSSWSSSPSTSCAGRTGSGRRSSPASPRSASPRGGGRSRPSSDGGGRSSFSTEKATRPPLSLSPYLRFSRGEWAALRADTPLTLTDADLGRIHGLVERMSLREIEEVYLPLSRLLNLHVEAVQGLSVPRPPSSATGRRRSRS